MRNSIHEGDEEPVDIIAPKHYQQAIRSVNSKKWDDAMKRELNALKSQGCYSLVPRPTAEKVLKCIWSYRIKTKNGEITQFKARCCANGSNTNFSDERTYSPVANETIITMFFAIASVFGYPIYNGDIPTAYVKAKIPEDINVYMEQPDGYTEKDRLNYVWKLNRALYGLPISGALWYSTLEDFLTKNGFMKSEVDSCAFSKTISCEKILVAVVVDDILITSSDSKIYEDFIKSLSGKFEYKDLGICNWYLSVRYNQNDNGITADQTSYAKSLIKKYRQIISRPYVTPMSSDFHQKKSKNVRKDKDFPYRQICGELRYLTKTRPDILFALNLCCCSQEDPSEEECQGLIRILGYLSKYPNLGLCFINGNPNEIDLKLSAYADSSYADCSEDERRSTYGFVILLNKIPICWKSRRTPVIALSVAEAEYIALCDCVKELAYINNFLKSIGLEVILPCIVYIDSSGAYDMSHSLKIPKRSRHIEVRFHYSRGELRKGFIKLIKIPSEKNVADMFTKPLDKNIFHKHLSSIMIEVDE